MKQESHLTTNRVTIIPNRCLILLIISIVLSCTVNCARISAPREIEIASYGISKYRIVVADDASHSTMHGAIELQMFLYRITGAVLPIFSDRLPMRNYEIIIGENEHLNNLDLDIDFTALGDEGYVLKTAGTYLVIAG
ncbi:MAG: hypothetical protein HOC71_08300, partial [Candidatus Latescibacteria bacterium]|nr:hypothetical protein [Candidatus Latescibacterota bacterium]